LRTGDLVRRLPFGAVLFAGRGKDVIMHGGYSVFAVEVERVLEQHPAVAEAAVLGLPDERMGEVVVAAVRLKPGTTAPVTDAELLQFARDRLADYKAPRRIRIVKDLPRTGTEKVQKAELRPLF
jgi:acyl-CoA synthetase (AMP-forming)/AMP-acid ligase II